MPLRARSTLLAATTLLATACVLGGTRPSAAPASGTGAWDAGQPAKEALTEVAATVHDGRIWIAGGLAADGQPVASVEVFDPATDAWEFGPGLPEPIHHSALVSDGEQIFLIGGYGFDGQPRDRVRVLRTVEPLGNAAWVEAGPLPESRAAGAAAWDGQERIVYAGGVGPSGVSDTIWAQGDRGWDPYGRLPVALEHLAAASDGAGAVYVVGGRRAGLDTNSARVTVVDASGARALGELPTPRGGVAAFWWPTLGACLVGGESPGGTNPEVECVAPDGRLTTLPDLARPRHGLGAVVLDGRAYALLGGEQPGLFVSDAVELLDLP